MNIKLLPRTVERALLALVLMSLTAVSLAAQKFDAKLSGVMKKAGIEKMEDGTYKPMHIPERVEIVKLLVRFSENKALDAIRHAGGTVNSVLGNVASVEMPAHLLGSLISINEIQYIEVEKSMPKRPSSRAPNKRSNDSAREEYEPPRTK